MMLSSILLFKKYIKNIRCISSLSSDGNSTIGVLSYDIYQQNDNNSNNTAVFLHGILGSKRNWRTPANTWLQLNSSYNTCVTIDHRGHGKSIGFNSNKNTNTINTCAKDTDNTLRYIENDIIHHKLTPTILFAHSFGGKVALRYLEQRWRSGMECPKHIWILDSMPGLYKEGKDDKQSVIQIINMLSSLPKQYDTREIMINQLIGLGLDKGVALWLATNLIPVKVNGSTVYQWGFDLNTMTDLFHNFCDEDLWSFLDEYNSKNNTDSIVHFLRAGKNSAWTTDIVDKLNNFSKKYKVTHNAKCRTLVAC